MVLSQVLVGLYMARVSSSPWPSLLAVIGICIALAVVGRDATHRPGIGTVVLVCALLMAVCLIIFLPGTPDELRFADLWYIPGCSLVLLMLCLRGRPLAAFVGLALVAGVTAAGVHLNGSESKQVAAAIFRSIVVLVLGSLLLAGIKWARRSAAQSRAAEIAGLEERAWAAELRTEASPAGRRDRRVLVGPALATIEQGRPLTQAEKQQCMVLEGRLRDDFRGGRLAREPLRSRGGSRPVSWNRRSPGRRRTGSRDLRSDAWRDCRTGWRPSWKGADSVQFRRSPAAGRTWPPGRRGRRRSQLTSFGG